MTHHSFLLSVFVFVSLEFYLENQAGLELRVILLPLLLCAGITGVLCHYRLQVFFLPFSFVWVCAHVHMQSPQEIPGCPARAVCLVLLKKNVVCGFCAHRGQRKTLEPWPCSCGGCTLPCTCCEWNLTSLEESPGHWAWFFLWAV